jgi:hypothetical protein
MSIFEVERLLNPRGREGEKTVAPKVPSSCACGRVTVKQVRCVQAFQFTTYLLRSAFRQTR